MDSPNAYGVNGQPTEAFDPNNATRKNATLAASTAENIAVPAGAKFVIITCDQDLWYNFNTTAAVPTNDSTDHDFVAAGVDRWIGGMQGVTNISVLSPSVAHVVARFWS